MASADLFLFPSLTETFGNVTLEALASGTPVLAFACAAARDLLQPGRNGWLVASGDDLGYVGQARQIGQDVHALQALRPCTAQSVASQGWEQIVGAVEAALRQTLARTAGA